MWLFGQPFSGEVKGAVIWNYHKMVCYSKSGGKQFLKICFVCFVDELYDKEYTFL